MPRLPAFGARGLPRPAIATFAVVLSTLVVLTTTPWSGGSAKLRLERSTRAHATPTTTTATSSTTTSANVAPTSTVTTSASTTTSTTTSTVARSGAPASAAPPPPPTTTTTTPGGACSDPSGQCLPPTPAGYSPVCLDDFTVDAPMGSWNDPTGTGNAVVYTGDHGCKWTEYPDGWPSTYTNGQPGYEPSQVLSVHNGVLDFYLHDVNGLPAGANPSPILSNTGSRYQTYGIYEIRAKVVYDDSYRLDDYYIAWLLWPQDDGNWQYAESDFPEANLADNQVCAYAHYGGSGSQDQFCTNVDFTQWHTYTQVWGPGYRSYYLDGQLIGTSTNQVWDQPERWQIQTEPSGMNDGDSGHVLVDWVAVYAPG